VGGDEACLPSEECCGHRCRFASPATAAAPRIASPVKVVAIKAAVLGFFATACPTVRAIFRKKVKGNFYTPISMIDRKWEIFI